MINNTYIYRFSVSFAFFAFVADITSLVGLSAYSPAIKYVYAAVLISLIAVRYVSSGYIDVSDPAPLLAILLFIATGLIFARNVVLLGINASYVTAFVAALVYAASAFVPPEALDFDADGACADMCKLFIVGSVAYLIEACIKANGGAPAIFFSPVIEHVKSIVCVLGISFCILVRRYRLLAILSAITAAAIIVRPSSTLLFTVVVTVPLALAIRERAIMTSRLYSFSVLITCASAPLIFYLFFDSASDIIASIEAYLKQEILGGHSNTDFRLAIFKISLRALDNSILIGEGLTGDATVPLALEFPWWLQVEADGTALIHSDWVVVLSQSGLIGYSLFVLMFLFILRNRFRWLDEVASIDSKPAVLVSLSIIGTVALIVYSATNPMLPLYHCVHLLWLLLFVSQIAMRPTVCSSANKPDLGW